LDKTATPDGDGARTRRRRRTAGLPTVLLAVLALAGCAAEPPAESDETAGLVFQVLPFDVQGQGAGADFVGLAFAESLAANLAQVDDLTIEGPASEVASGRPTRRISGTLLRDGQAIRASLSLRDGDSDAVLWETETSPQAIDLSALASGLARQTVEAIGIPFPALYDHIDNVSASTGTDPDLVASARELRRHGDSQGFLEAAAGLALRFPDDPAVHALHAWALLFAWDAAPSSETYLAQLKERLAVLDRVDPTSPYDEFLRAYVYRSSGQPDQALALYSRILARTDLTHAARGWALRQRAYTHLQLGNADAARDDAEVALGLDPSNAASFAALSKAQEIQGELEDAIASSNRALALQPSAWRHHQRLGLVLSRAERYDEALAALDRACALSGSQEPCANLAVSLVRADREAEARDAARHAESLSPNRWGLYNLACHWALAGHRDRAVAALHRSLELGFADALIKTDPDLERLRHDEEFESIVTSVGERLKSRRELTRSVFPWQARLSTSPPGVPA
jgi:tetratricopeptide (TPR) repeat protein